MKAIVFVHLEQSAFRAIRRTFNIPYSCPNNRRSILWFGTQTSPESTAVPAETSPGTEKESKEGEAKSLSWTIEKLSRGDSVSSAFRRWMGEGFPIHRGEIFHTINRLRRLKSSKRALEVMEWVIRERPYKPKELDYSYLLEFTMKFHGVAQGETLFSRIPSEFQNELLYNNLVLGCLERGLIRLSLAYMKKMRELGHTISYLAFNRLIILHSSPSRRKAIPKILTQMRADKVARHVSTCNILLKIEADEHNIEGLLKVFGDMKRMMVEPNEISYCILAISHAEARLYTACDPEIQRSREGADRDARGKGGALSTQPSLQRTYSIHHLESVDDFIGKIPTDWNTPIIFFPTNSPDSSSHNLNDSPKDTPDVFEIFKVDKDLLLKHLQDSDESVANFSRSAFGVKPKRKFSKSRSFPAVDLAQRKNLKPLKLESKHKEVWSFPRDDNAQSPGLDKSQPSESMEYREDKNAVDRIGEKHDGESDGIKKYTHRRSSSLTESLDKYARLFGNSFGKDIKLTSSQSLRFTSEYGYTPLYSERKRSFSHADSYYSHVNLEVLGETYDVIAEDSSSSGLQIREEEDTVPLNENIKEHDASDKLQESDTLKEAQDSDIFLQDSESSAIELHVPKGKEHDSRIPKLDSSLDTDDLQSIENYEIKEKTMYPHKKTPDLDYVRHLLHNSSIAMDACEMPWHASDQLFGPQLFEEVEAGWHHEEEQLDGLPDFQGCWHHQLLFDLVNEVLLDVYDISLPYYPKALSSSCHVSPFPMGGRIIEEVCASIGTLMNMKQTLDSIEARDLAHDRRWMNLQLDSESIAVYLEELIFDELLQEVIFS